MAGHEDAPRVASSSGPDLPGVDITAELDGQVTVGRCLPALTQALYPRLLPIARDWAKLGREAPWPDTLDRWLDTWHAAGQTSSTPILLEYGQGGWNV